MTREEAIEVLKKSIDNTIEMTIREWEAFDLELAEAIDMAIEALQREEAKAKGEWIKKQVFNPELDRYVPLIECSVCGYEPYFGGSESKYNYCSNCGARMEGGAE